jgi:thiol-disulfide isomerase/thioredoxin
MYQFTKKVGLGMLLLILTTLGLSAKSQTGFTIQGNIKGIPNLTRLFLVHNLNGKADTVGTAVSENGQFKFKGSVALEGEFHFIKIDGTLPYLTLLLDNSIIEILGDKATWPVAMVSGSAVNDNYQEMLLKINAPKKDMDEMDSQLATVANSKDTIALKLLEEKQKRAMDVFLENWERVIEAYPNSLWTPSIISRLSRWDVAKKKSAYEKLSLRAQNSLYGRELKEEIEIGEKTQKIAIGAKVPNFTSKDIDGNKIDLYTILAKNKLTFIDFWASWCVPCLEETPNIKKVFEKFNKRGFGVLGVSLDNDGKSWKKSILKEGMTWDHVSQLKGRDEDAGRMFNLNGIPASVLLGADGTILGMDLPGSDIPSKVHSLRGDGLYKTVDSLLSKVTIDVNQISKNITAGVEPLKMGDKLPDISISKIKNYKSPSINLSDLKGKLVILDFWNKGCSSCIAAFPEMERLQNTFGDKIQVILVTDDSDEDLAGLYKKSFNLKNTKLPMITNDSLLHKYFPHMGVPFHVWISADGMVTAMTNSSSTTEGNIKKYLSGADLKLVVRSDETDIKGLVEVSSIKQFNASKDQYQQLECYSIITKKNKLSPQSRGVSINLNTEGLTGKGGVFRSQNSTILMLFGSVFYRNGALSYYKKVIVEPSKKENIEKYYPPGNKDDVELWNENNQYCYEYLLPSFVSKLPPKEYGEWVRKMIKQDLERFFGINSFIENRDVKCMVLTKISDKNRFMTKGGELGEGEAQNGTYVFRNTSISVIQFAFGKMLNQNTENEIPFINETQYDGNVDMDIKLDVDLKTLNQLLAKYDLKLTEQVRNVPCLILKEVY